MNTSHALRTTKVVRILLLRIDIAESLRELMWKCLHTARFVCLRAVAWFMARSNVALACPCYVDDCEQTSLSV
jgi:hypothetical protein